MKNQDGLPSDAALDHPRPDRPWVAIAGLYLSLPFTICWVLNMFAEVLQAATGGGESSPWFRLGLMAWMWSIMSLPPLMVGGPLVLAAILLNPRNRWSQAAVFVLAAPWVCFGLLALISLAFR